jgi:D-alanyl-D-alanine dipeptidase
MKISNKTLCRRLDRVTAAMDDFGIDVLLVAASADLKWLTGDNSIDPDSMSCLIIELDGTATLAVGPLEAPGIDRDGKPFDVVPLIGKNGKTLPGLITRAVRRAELRPDRQSKETVVAYNGEMKAAMLAAIQSRTLPFQAIRWILADDGVVSRHRRTKNAAEIRVLRAVAKSIDKVVEELQSGCVPLYGRTEKAVARDIAALMLRYGHDEVKFTIVAFGANAAKPHHVPGDTVIGEGILLLDIGGTRDGYNSDTTRCLYIGQPPCRVRRAWHLLQKAQDAAFRKARAGVATRAVDAAARNIIERAGHGKRFFHSTGHGIGLDVHEAPRVSSKSDERLAVGDVFSIEPGVYFPGDFGLRLEDIVVLTRNGPQRLNRTSREMVCLSARPTRRKR